MDRPSKEQVEEALKLSEMAGQNTCAWQMAFVLAAEVEALQATIHRVEELLPAWRTESSYLRRNHDDDVSFCIADLEAALKGEP